MESFKLFAGITAAVTVVVGSLIVSESIFAADKLEKQAYVVEVAQTDSSDASGKASGPAYATGEAFAALVAQGDIKKGEGVSKKCSACHDMTSANANRVGPGLWNLDGREVGGHPGFAYSGDLKALGGKWDDDKLNHWLYNPKAYVKGTKMAFAGIKDDKQRADLIAYLKSLK